MEPSWGDGRFIGLIDPDLIGDEIARAVPCVGPAGSMSLHHVRALHGSALNTSDRPRNLLLYEVAASDAWPLMGVKDFDEFDSRLLAGPSIVTPRLTDVPVRMPLPPPARQGSIYETQSASRKSFFTRAAWGALAASSGLSRSGLIVRERSPFPHKAASRAWTNRHKSPG